MNIDHLKEFIFLSDTLSFSATARRFYLSQSVLSKHIASMEEEVGTKLFVRDSHHVRLTEGGRIFQESARAIVNEYARAAERLEAFNESYEAFVRVGYLRNAARLVLPKFLSEMKKNHPRVSIKIVCMEYGELNYAIASRRVDMGFTLDLDRVLRDQCDSLPLYSDRFYAVTSFQHPLSKSKAEGVSSSDLATQKLLLPSGASYPGMDEFVCSFLPGGCEVENVAYYDDVDTLYLRVECEGFLGFSSGHNKPLFQNSVAFLPLVDVAADYNVSAMWLKSANREGVADCIEAVRAISPVLP